MESSEYWIIRNFKGSVKQIDAMDEQINTAEDSVDTEGSLPTFFAYHFLIGGVLFRYLVGIYQRSLLHLQMSCLNF